MLTCLVPVLFTIYIQGVLKFKKKNNSNAKGLKFSKSKHSPENSLYYNRPWQTQFLPNTSYFATICRSKAI